MGKFYNKKGKIERTTEEIEFERNKEECTLPLIARGCLLSDLKKLLLKFSKIKQCRRILRD